MTDVRSRNAPWCPPHSFSPVANTSSPNLLSTVIMIIMDLMVSAKLNLKNIVKCFINFFVENPVLQSFVKSITIKPEWRNCTQLIAILRLPFCYLPVESFSIRSGPTKWNKFSNELKDALLTIIHSSTIKTLCVEHALVPIVLSLVDLNLTKLELTAFWPNEFVGKQSRLLTPAASDSEGVATTTASHTVVDHCKCKFFGPVEGTRFPTFGYFSLI